MYQKEGGKIIAEHKCDTFDAHDKKHCPQM